MKSLKKALKQCQEMNFSFRMTFYHYGRVYITEYPEPGHKSNQKGECTCKAKDIARKLDEMVYQRELDKAPVTPETLIEANACVDEGMPPPPPAPVQDLLDWVNQHKLRQVYMNIDTRNRLRMYLDKAGLCALSKFLDVSITFDQGLPPGRVVGLGGVAEIFYHVVPWEVTT